MGAPELTVHNRRRLPASTAGLPHPPFSEFWGNCGERFQTLFVKFGGGASDMGEMRRVAPKLTIRRLSPVLPCPPLVRKPPTVSWRPVAQAPTKPPQRWSAPWGSNTV